MKSIKHFFFVKPHGNKSFGNASHRWMYYVKMFLKERNHVWTETKCLKKEYSRGTL